MKKKILKVFMKIGNVLGATILGLFTLALLWFAIKFICYLGMIVVWFFNMAMGDEKVDHYLYNFEIQAMKDSHTYVTRRYSGDSELEYYFIREMDGRIHTGHTDADSSSIIEDGQNKVDVYIEAPKVGTKLYLKLDEWASWDGETITNKSYEYHIPEGSIKEDFNIDLE